MLITLLTLLQTTASEHAGPSYQSLAIAALSLLQVILLLWAKAINDDRKELRNKVDKQAEQLMQLATHMGVGGSSGVLAAIEKLNEEVRGLRADVHTAFEELAEQRGARSRHDSPR